MNRIISEKLYSQVMVRALMQKELDRNRAGQLALTLKYIEDLRNAPTALDMNNLTADHVRTIMDNHLRWYTAEPRDDPRTLDELVLSTLRTLHITVQVGEVKPVTNNIEYALEAMIMVANDESRADSRIDSLRIMAKNILEALRTQPQTPCPSQNHFGVDYDDGGFKIHCKYRGVVLHLSHDEAKALASQLAQPRAPVIPDGYLFQHGETGRTTFIMPDEVGSFSRDNPRWSNVGPMYRQPQAPVVEMPSVEEIEKVLLELTYGSGPVPAMITYAEAIHALLQSKGTKVRVMPIIHDPDDWPEPGMDGGAS